MTTFRLTHPNPHSQGAPAIVKDLEVMQGKSLKLFFSELGINGLRNSCRLIRALDHAPLRTSYVPQPGDVILMRRG
jgi:hypothetical protein